MTRKLTKTQTDEWTIWNYTKLPSNELVEALQRAKKIKAIPGSHPKVRKEVVGKTSLAFKEVSKADFYSWQQQMFPISFFKRLEEIRAHKAPVEIPIAVLHNKKTKERHIATLWHADHMNAPVFFKDTSISSKVKEKAALELVRKIGALHREGITHGHLFTNGNNFGNNILINTRGNVRIIDYSEIGSKPPRGTEKDSPYLIRSALNGEINLLEAEGYKLRPDELTLKLKSEYEKARR